MACPNLAHLPHLDLGSNPIGEAGAVALANSAYLMRLKVLGLATSPHLAALEELVLYVNPLTDVAGDALVRWPIAALRQVHLTRNRFSNAMWDALTARFGEGLGSY